jgi:mevalonate kinase
MNDEYKDIFEEIDEILTNLLIVFEEEKVEKLKNIIINSKDRVDLFFDALKPITN